MKGPLDSLQIMQRCACLWIAGAFKTSPMGAAETLAGMPPIHLHVKKLVERSHVCAHSVQASHTFCRLVDRDHKFSVKTLKGQIQGDLKSPITEAWLNLDFSSLDLDPVNRFNHPGLCPKDLYHRCVVYDIVSSRPKTDKDHKKFMADRINLLHGSVDAPPTPPNTSALSQTHPPLPYPSSQSWLSTSGMRGTSMTTGLQPVLLRLTMLNCKQLQTVFNRSTMLVWRMYIKYMPSPTLLMCSA
jgi:hypothetical protein